MFELDERYIDGFPEESREEVDNTDRSFIGQQKHEEIMLCTRLHPIIILPYVFGIALITAIFFAIVYGTSNVIPKGEIMGQILLFGVFSAYMYYLHRFFNKLLNYYLHVVILTNYRVIEVIKTVYFCNNKDTIDLHKIQDLKKDQDGLFCTIFNYGTLVVEVSAIHETKRVRYLPNPDKWFQTLNKVKRSYIERRRAKVPRGGHSPVVQSSTYDKVGVSRSMLHNQMIRVL
ncbi:hypothetical protein HOG48_01560 [Candidatus Peregrinibacteria bacterium]|jgi:hypothetical protein|nr:hypothetical protein [Candidatus Peregrinibacteria bacterium]